MSAGGQAWGQTPIREGKFTLADSTVFWVTYDVKWKNHRVVDREAYPYITTRGDSMSLENMLTGEILAKHKLVSQPSLQEICEKNFRRNSSVRFAPWKKFLHADVHLNPVDMEIWSILFLLPKENNNVVLEDLATIRHAIHKLYWPKVVSETDFYMHCYDYLSDSVTLFYDDSDD